MLDFYYSCYSYNYNFNHSFMYKLSSKKGVKYSKQELFDNIKRVWDFKGSQPFLKDMEVEPSVICWGTYFNRFGSWQKALEEFIKHINSADKIQYEENINIKKSRKSINNSLRYDVMKRDSFKCQYCGKSPANDVGVELQIDHILPVSKGGTNEIENLKTICKDCNIGKFNK